MTDTFKCKLELEAFEKIKRLLWALDDNWRILTTEQCTVESRCLAFRILMRQIGVLKALLYDAAKGCPYMPFGILEGLVTVEDLRSLYTDRRDHVAELLVSDSKYSKDGTVTTLGKALLTCLSIMSRTDVVPLECLHGTVRKLALRKSLQAWQRTLSDVSGDFVLQRNREIERDRLRRHKKDKRYIPKRFGQRRRWKKTRPKKAAAHGKRGNKVKKKIVKHKRGGGGGAHGQVH